MEEQIKINKAFLQCLADEPAALEYFNPLPGAVTETILVNGLKALKLKKQRHGE